MDILLLNASVLELPTARRASAIVYDGTQDLRLWRPPGADRDLWHAYGDDLQDLLDRERARLGGELPIGSCLRLSPGKLRCDFLLWVASRPPHGEVEPSPAPSLATIEQVALEAARFVEGRDVTRLAFGALGAGQGAQPVEERLAAIVRALDAHRDECLSQGRALVIEEVIVSDRSPAALAKAKRLVAAKAKQIETPAPKESAAPTKKKAAKATGTRKTATRRARPKGLDPEGLERAHDRAEPYDRTHTYLAGEWFVHSRFGAGQVRDVLTDRMVMVLFEDGAERRLVHSR